MGMQQTPRSRRSPWVRYAPFIAVIVIVAIVAVALGTRSSGTKKTAVTVTGGSVGVSGQNGVPLFYNDAKAKGELAKYTWQEHCDTATGRVAIPIIQPPPCVPKVTGDNFGATSPGVTADTIRLGYYIAKPDPLFDGVLKASGVYDPPENSAKAYRDYAQIYQSLYELYGRKVQMVRVDGTGSSSDPVAARADADRAAAENLFGVIGGPAQAKQFGDELAQKHVLCIGACLISQPQRYLTENAPYMWPVSPSPDETSTMVTEFIKKQLLGKPTQWAGPALNGKPRTFTLLTYNTPDGQFTSSWDDLEKKVKAAGATVVDHVDYYLDVSKLQTDARTIAAKLRQANATSIIFTGDPIFPQYLTKEMTNEGYFPEWVMSGTVLADTNAFARDFDQRQWAHAFGLQLIPARFPKDKQDAYTMHEWFFGTKPPTDNNYAIIKGDVELAFDGLQLAGPKLTPDAFKAGLDAAPPPVPGDVPTRRTIATYGDHGFWPGTPDDPAGLDNAGILWWDPNAVGQDETGKVGKGMYRLMNGGLRYITGHWPTEPLKLFDPTNTVTIYGENNIPAELLPKCEPHPSDAPSQTPLPAGTCTT
jgi:Periplasmic binding protein